jgi:hypothetical protein
MTAPTGSVPSWIFMSYRRDDTAYPAAWLYKLLASHFGNSQVFKDVNSIELGVDFVEVITAAVGFCDVLLALIGDRWLSVTGPDGRRRLDDPGDFVRLEIEAALARNIRVVPILVEGARMPRADELPASLAMLTRRQALELSPNQFDAESERLISALDRAVAEAHQQAAREANLVALAQAQRASEIELTKNQILQIVASLNSKKAAEFGRAALAKMATQQAQEETFTGILAPPPTTPSTPPSEPPA